MPMTVDHEPTEQEQAILDHLEAGEHDELDALREAAHAADPKPPTTPPPKGWKPPVAQYNVDHMHAVASYQDEHEAPEGEREAQTAASVEDENAARLDDAQ